MSCQNLTAIDEIGQDALKDSPFHRPVQEIIENPEIPYSGPLPFQLDAGRMTTITGSVPEYANRFAVDFACGCNENDDIAFHFNPRFDEKYVVRNSRIKDRWGEEEDSVPQKCPFKQGEEFTLVIFVAEEQFMVSVNSRHLCNFSFRVPLESVCSLSVSGDVVISRIEHQRAMQYPEVSPQRTNLFNHIDSTTQDRDDDDLLSPPYIGVLTEQFEIGKEVELVGRVKMLPQSFYLNLQKGQHNWPHPIILLHINPHFLVRTTSKTRVVFNSWISEKWGREEIVTDLPFSPGEPFLLNIKCEKDYFTITVDSKLVAKYKHRCLPELIDTIVIDGDTWIKSIVVR